MPLPIAPVAGIALRYGAVALAAYAVARNARSGHFDQRGEDALDDVGEGVTFRRDTVDQVNATGRVKRTVRLGSAGPGFEIDVAAFGRFRVRRV
ncbi:MAG: hypothetical protein AAFR35_15845 [Pseudomonadota bacterium]